MQGNNNHIVPSPEYIQLYLEGKLSDREMHALEKMALDDPFLAEALEGYGGKNTQQAPHLNDLQARLQARLVQPREQPASEEEAIIVPITKKRRVDYRWAAAAVILIILSVSTLILRDYQGQEKNTSITVAEDIKSTTAQPDQPADPTPVPAAPNAEITADSLTFLSPSKNVPGVEKTDVTPGSFADGYIKAEHAQEKKGARVAQAPAPPAEIAADQQNNEISMDVARPKMKAARVTDSKPLESSLNNRAAGIALEDTWSTNMRSRLNVNLDSSKRTATYKYSYETMKGFMRDLANNEDKYFFAPGNMQVDTIKIARRNAIVVDTLFATEGRLRGFEAPETALYGKYFRNGVLVDDNTHALEIINSKYRSKSMYYGRDTSIIMDAKKSQFSIASQTNKTDAGKFNMLNPAADKYGYNANNVSNNVVSNLNKGNVKKYSNANNALTSNASPFKQASPLMGFQAYDAYIMKTVNDPAAVRDNVNGEVELSFSVMPVTGELTNFIINKALTPKNDLLAVETIKRGPKWLPSSDSKPTVIRILVVFVKLDEPKNTQ
ncbi:hypothetical protein LX64_02734 [Chitinophaga skermanii]|uniref:TonB-like protein n=1 Tax=Chitinophaga skermanii TaxID=331697 RepID=A0A327QQ08_9BACT|nr:hypothetical protein [Chitinophaga skermanii]RAJ03857.1 hypothetical protein LX64_02734 [Chitinophaga skermanii]